MVSQQVSLLYFVEQLQSVSFSFFTLQPFGLEEYCRHGSGGRVGGRLPNLRNPYLCNHLTDFLHSKFCGIIFENTGWIYTIWNCWMDLPHLKFHGHV